MNASPASVNITSVSPACNTECIWSFWIHGVVVPFISIPGIAGNIACVFVFNNKSVDLKPSFANLLKCLSIYDIVFLFGVTCLYTLPELSTTYTKNIEPYVTPILLPCTQVALTGSVYCVIAVAVERYFNVCKPFDRSRVGNYDGLGYVIVIVLISFAYNIIKFFEVETALLEEFDAVTNTSIKVAKARLTEMRRNPVYATAYIVCNTILMGIFPIFILWFLNWRIISAMKQATRRHNNISSLQRRDRAMTALLSGVVLVLILCHSPKTIINIYESYQMIVYGRMKFTPLWGSIVIKFSHLLLSISSALNIIIYSYKDFKFRAVVASLFRGKSYLKNRRNMTDETTQHSASPIGRKRTKETDFIRGEDDISDVEVKIELCTTAL